MRDELVIALAKLASKDYQIRYIIEGTADTYVMPEEILEDVDGLCLRAQRPENKIRLTRDEIVALQNLASAIDRMSGDALLFHSRPEAMAAISDGPVWEALRSEAARTLEKFGIDVEQMSVEDIDKGRLPTIHTSPPAS